MVGLVSKGITKHSSGVGIVAICTEYWAQLGAQYMFFSAFLVNNPLLRVGGHDFCWHLEDHHMLSNTVLLTDFLFPDLKWNLVE